MPDDLAMWQEQLRRAEERAAGVRQCVLMSECRLRFPRAWSWYVRDDPDAAGRPVPRHELSGMIAYLLACHTYTAVEPRGGEGD
jgi:hypothetical protein